MSSDTRRNLPKCPAASSLKIIHIYAADTFYVDSDLYLNKTIDVELNVFAPKWNIHQAATFYLNGVDGGLHPLLNVAGLPGKAGILGTHAGNFFGIANEMMYLISIC